MINARNLINSEKLDPRRIYHLLVRRAPSNIVGYSTHNWSIFGRRHELCVCDCDPSEFYQIHAASDGQSHHADEQGDPG